MKKRLKNQRRAGHTETLPGCAALLLSIVFTARLFRIPGLKPALKALNFGAARLALILLWGLSLFASIVLLVLLNWLYTKCARKK